MNWRTKIQETGNIFIEGESYGEICESIKKYREGNVNSNQHFTIEFFDSEGEWIEVDSLSFADTGEIEVVRASHLAVVN